MKIGLGCISWQQPEGLKRLLDSTNDFDERIIIDGKFGRYGEGPDYSDYEFVKSYRKTRLINAAGLTQAQKRNIYFQESKSDVLVILDDDEYLTKFNKKEFINSIQDKEMYLLPTLVLHHEWILNYNPRIFRNPNKKYYKERHNQVYENERAIQITRPKNIARGIEAKHDKVFRTKEREENNLIYYTLRE